MRCYLLANERDRQVAVGLHRSYLPAMRLNCDARERLRYIAMLFTMWPAAELRTVSPTNPGSINSRFKAGVGSVVSFSNVDVICYDNECQDA
jgi:hypothetical protein